MTGLYIIKKKIMMRDKIKVTVKWNDAFSSKIKICVIGQSKHFQTLWIWSIMPVTCPALGDLNIYTKQISSWSILLYQWKAYKKSDGLYKRVCTFNKFNITVDATGTRLVKRCK